MRTFNTIKKYLSDEEKFEEALLEYKLDFSSSIEPIYIYPEGYHEMTEEEIEYEQKIMDLIYEAEINDDVKEVKRLGKLLSDPGPLPIIDIEKTMELIPDKAKQYFIDALDKEQYMEYVELKCLNCDYQEEAPYDIIEECWESGPYPISYCPHCNKPKLVPIDIYNKKKKMKQ